ncbi:1556_t:CDS:2, partial [Gigaspora margarita]
LSLEESGQLAQIPSNQSITSLVAKIKTNLLRLPQLAVIDIKFSSRNPYLAQQQSANFHEQTQVIDDIEAQPETNSPNKKSNTTMEQETLQNETLNLEQLNKNNDKGVRELDEHTKEEAKQEKENRIEIALNITINREDTTEEIEAKKMSYSKAVGRYQKKQTKKAIEHIDYDRIIKVMNDLEILVTLIK